jgi:preprotein translocase subunit SecB
MTETVETAERLVKITELRDVIYHRVSAQRQGDNDGADEKPAHRIEVMARHGQNRQGKSEIGVRCRAEVTAAGGRYTADAEAIFDIAEEVEIAEAAVQEFVSRVGVMVVYPYLRAAISDGAARLRLSPPVMQVIKPGGVILSQQAVNPPSSGDEAQSTDPPHTAGG